MIERANGSSLATVDDFEVGAVVAAVRSMRWTDKMTAVVRALAGAPDRALSRLEMARAIGSASVNSTNSVLGHFAKALALELDAKLADQWKPAGGSGGGDWVVFTCVGGNRTRPAQKGDTDGWVFVLRENLALALDQAGIAAYVSISDEAGEVMWPDGEDEDEYEDQRDVVEEESLSDDPLVDIASVEGAGELEELSVTEREAVVTARVGQGRFRQELLARWDSRCAVTGSAVEAAIVASHIKPWMLSTNAERVDPANGLPLVGTLDRLFDYGLISFDETGRILISPRIPREEYGHLQLTPSLRLRRLPADTSGFLEYHRSACYWETADTGDVDDETG